MSAQSPSVVLNVRNNQSSMQYIKKHIHGCSYYNFQTLHVPNGLPCRNCYTFFLNQPYTKPKFSARLRKMSSPHRRDTGTNKPLRPFLVIPPMTEAIVPNKRNINVPLFPPATNWLQRTLTVQCDNVRRVVERTICRRISRTRKPYRNRCKKELIKMNCQHDRQPGNGSTCQTGVANRPNATNRQRATHQSTQLSSREN